ncbi:hypothetical protein MNEG_4367 [Monoraphidium neglectum]|uniref:Uncharacterized protein n=1 Tax=Monoraphidium neglectum TaxID=145388 RepID=A0A0D2JYF2_9CHLO|nr:hypothetical protein MNEG_4367 [Monoraphidium neglectum]KIZ03593.1 hypothetical protein MNEG_4367 [Monoraphidium neglectum]|eukprot:XP_013902612.1 hypothetical protein MNEG_4367 [Monoraphidium neglectum]
MNALQLKQLGLKRIVPERPVVAQRCTSSAWLVRSRPVCSAAALSEASAATAVALGHTTLLARASSEGPALLAQVSEGPDFIQLGGVVGIALGAVFLALWNLERQSAARGAAEAAALRAEVAARDEELGRLRAELQAERKKREEAEGLEARLSSASKDIMKLEKALEIKDGQLDVFLATARRQIKALEEDVRQLQQMPR